MVREGKKGLTMYLGIYYNQTFFFFFFVEMSNKEKVQACFLLA